MVEQDEREQRERRILNFGHTFGHAVEALTGISHGEAVSIGMMMAARRSVAECGFPKSHFDRLECLLLRLGLPVTTDLPSETIHRTLLKDKKRENNLIHFILLLEIGKTTIQKTPIENLKPNHHE